MENKDVELLRNLLSNLDPHSISELSRVLTPKAELIAEDFYRNMLSHPESSGFLSNEKVEGHLKPSMTHWIMSLVSSLSKDEIEGFIHNQIEIGNKHARINIPLIAIHIGTSVLKQSLFRTILDSDIQRNQLADVVILLDNLVDQSIAVMNRTYFTDLLSDAQDQQALKLQSLGMDMALQTEALRSSLFDWHRQVLGLLMDAKIELNQIPSVKRTNFGLWVQHKGDLLFPGSNEISKLKQLMEKIDDVFNNAVNIRPDGLTEQMRHYMKTIDDHVTSSTAVLGSITEQTLALEGGRDPLTKLFNRRFLRTILQREVKVSMATNERFAVLLIDLDHFKKINDQYGHDAGDSILRQIAEILMTSVRAGDFVFRYGGEEFLTVLNSVSRNHAQMVAEKIRQNIQHHNFEINSKTKLKITASIGIAIHDGHPDFNNIVQHSDNALYQAKENGRNQVVFYI